MGLHFYKNLWTGFAISKDHNAMSSTQRRVLKQQLRVVCELSAEVPIFGWVPVAVYHFLAVPNKGHFTECFSDISIINGSYFNWTGYEWSMTASDTCASSSNTQTVHQCLDRIMLIKCTLEAATFCTVNFRDYRIPHFGSEITPSSWDSMVLTPVKGVRFIPHTKGDITHHK